LTRACLVNDTWLTRKRRVPRTWHMRWERESHCPVSGTGPTDTVRCQVLAPLIPIQTRAAGDFFNFVRFPHSNFTPTRTAHPPNQTADVPNYLTHTPNHVARATRCRPSSKGAATPTQWCRPVKLFAQYCPILVGFLQCLLGNSARSLPPLARGVAAICQRPLGVVHPEKEGNLTILSDF
jgi:hypothetical protein